MSPPLPTLVATSWMPLKEWKQWCWSEKIWEWNACQVLLAYHIHATLAWKNEACLFHIILQCSASVAALRKWQCKGHKDMRESTSKQPNWQCLEQEFCLSFKQGENLIQPVTSPSHLYISLEIQASSSCGRSVHSAWSDICISAGNAVVTVAPAVWPPSCQAKEPDWRLPLVPAAAWPHQSLKKP